MPSGSAPVGVEQRDSARYHDYTENAPQAVVDAIAIERAREEKEAPPDMMVGSFQSWAGNEGEYLLQYVPGASS